MIIKNLILTVTMKQKEISKTVKMKIKMKPRLVIRVILQYRRICLKAAKIYDRGKYICFMIIDLMHRKTCQKFYVKGMSL